MRLQLERDDGALERHCRASQQWHTPFGRAAQGGGLCRPTPASADSTHPTATRQQWHRPRCNTPLIIALLALFCCPQPALAQTRDAWREMIEQGEYEKCLAELTTAVERGLWGEDYPLQKGELELLLGRPRAALETVDAALRRYQWSVRLRWLAARAARTLGERRTYDRMIDEINTLVGRSMWRYTNRRDLVALGEVALAMGTDAKQVLDVFFDQAQRMDEEDPAPALAMAKLAIDKEDFALAADQLRPFVTDETTNPDLLYWMAEAHRHGDRAAAERYLARVQEINPRHVPSLIMRAELLVDAEAYDEANKVLEVVDEVHSIHPEAWAIRAGVAEVLSDEKAVNAALKKALALWNKNPEVPYVMGTILARKYRFEEAARRQRQALQWDRDYLAAKRALAENLLRLGQHAEGWQLIGEVYAEDKYDVTAFNLLELQDEMASFKTFEADGLRIRMGAEEADVYGPEVVELLTRAKQVLCEKYQHELREPVYVEIFPNSDDFAVRTFGIPGAGGYLGVCFGNVVTARSATANPPGIDWKSVLWHEFCHVVTLQRTNNRMPRWLSEGISVYEERQADPYWGERMDRTYRDLIAKGELQPIGEMSAAFLAPKHGVMFAYYQSSLVVEMLAQQFGLPALNGVLDDLAKGVTINDALSRHCAPLEELDARLEKFARAKLQDFAPDATFDVPEELTAWISRPDGIEKLRQYLENDPGNVPVRTMLARLLERQGDVRETIAQWRRIINVFPNDTSGTSAWVELAVLLREQGDTQAERRLLQDYVEAGGRQPVLLMRLADLAREDRDWSAVLAVTDLLESVNPMLPALYQSRAEAAEAADDHAAAIGAYRALLRLAPDDPSELNYRLGVHLSAVDRPDEAKRHALLALERTPRFRSAQQLLLAVVRGEAYGVEGSVDESSPQERSFKRPPPPDLPQDRSRSAKF